MTRRKNGFFTFCFSLLPGAGEMYLGFMKMGISLMGMFFGLIALADVLNISQLLYIGVVLWFYSFFHVHNLSGLSDAVFANVRDEYLFNVDAFFSGRKDDVKKYRKVLAYILIIAGVLMLWNGVMDICYNYLPEMIVRVLRRIGYVIPQFVAGIGIIIGGLYMIRGKKEELNEVPVLPVSEMNGEGTTYGTEDNQNS